MGEDLITIPHVGPRCTKAITDHNPTTGQRLITRVEKQAMHERSRGTTGRVYDQSALLDAGRIERAKAVVCQLACDTAVIGSADEYCVACGLSPYNVNVQAPVGGVDEVRAGTGGKDGGAWDNYGLSSWDGIRKLASA